MPRYHIETCARFVGTEGHFDLYWYDNTRVALIVYADNCSEVAAQHMEDEQLDALYEMTRFFAEEASHAA